MQYQLIKWALPIDLITIKMQKILLATRTKEDQFLIPWQFPQLIVNHYNRQI
jgi:hypothetical protein